MEQKRIGEFIASLRKEKGLTQKELANQISVSDKTVSKWENGNSVPDSTMLLTLCKALDISVNELLSCEKLPPDEYSKKAEENMMSLIKNSESSQKQSKIAIVIGVVLGILSIVLLYVSVLGGITRIVNYIDVPSILWLVLMCAATTILSGAKTAKDRVRVVQKTLIPASVFVCLFSLVAILINIVDVEVLEVNLAVAVLPPIYALLAFVILIPVREHLEKKN